MTVAIRHCDRADQLLNGFQHQLGADLIPYRNHVYRVMNLTVAFRPQITAAERDLLAVAAVFHDIGIWTHGSLDYLGPSAEQAVAWLDQHPEVGEGALADREDLLRAMILEHHKVRAITDPSYALAEAFRRADWTDVTLGTRRFGLPYSEYRELCRAFPDAGFHWRLVQLFGRRLRHAPWSPLPMLRW